MLEAATLAMLQGLTEWLPVSSEGIVTLAGAWLFNLTLSEALAFALWLHLGTAIAALVYLRREVLSLIREVLTIPRRPSPLLSFTVLSVLSSGAVGFPLLLAFANLSTLGGASAMIAIGLLMLPTGWLQLKHPPKATRARGDLTWADGLLVGIAQGFAVLPGLSRSGLTVAFLLARRIERREALALSFLIGIPASLGAAIFASAETAPGGIPAGALGAVVAAIVGLLAMRVLLDIASRIRLGAFVLLTGFAIIAGGIWQFWVA